MNKPLEETASETIDFLEARMHRIEYVIHGQLPNNAKLDTSSPASKRLRDLEYSLDRLIAKSRTTQELLRLYSRHPELFQSLDVLDAPKSIDPSDQAAIVMAAASSYPMTASGLTSILDAPIPAPKCSAQLIATRSQVAELEIQQQAYTTEIASLKQRSVTVLQRWYSVDVLGTGEYWAEVEGRVGRAERIVRQTESARRTDEGII